MAQENPYLQLVQDDLSGSVKGAMQVAADKNPDVEAKLLKLANAAGVPLEAARLDTVAVERQVALQEIDYKTLAERYPSTAQLLTDPVNAALAKDDVKSLSFLEDTLNFGVNSLRSLGTGLIPKANAGLWGVAQAGAEVAAGVAQPLVGRILPANPFGIAAEKFGQFRKEQAAEAARWRGDQQGMGFTQKSALSGFESLGMNAILAPASVLSGSPAPMLAGVTAMTGGDAYGQARDKGMPVVGSVAFASSQAMVEYATEKLPALALLRDVGMKKSFVKTLANQMVSEGWTEQVATAVQDLNEWAALNPEKPFAEYIAERPNAALQTLIATAVATGGQVTIAKVADRVANGPREQRNLELLNTLKTGVIDSKTFERAPERVKAFIAKHTEGGPIENIFIPAEQYQQYFQDMAIDPAIAAVEMGAKNYLEALATGGDVVIPLADFITSTAKTSHFDGLVNDIRFDQGEMTAREADLYAKNNPDIINQLLQQAAGDSQQISSEQISGIDRAIREITSDIEGQLLASGTERGTAQSQSQVMRAMAIMATRAYPERDPYEVTRELFDKYELNITSPMADILTTLGNSDIEIDPLLDRLRSGDVPTDAIIHGPTLMEFLRSIGGVRDEGGELRRMDVDRNNAAWTKNLIQLTGKAVDEAAALAREAGYPVDDVLAAIEQEMQGKPVYSAANANEQLLGLRRDLDSLGEYLKSLGVDLNAATNEQVREAMAAAVGDVYNQSARAAMLPERQASTFDQAREAADQFRREPIKNEATGMEATVSRNNLDKMLNGKAVGKSETPALHSLAVANLDNLFKRAILGWSKPDRDADPNIVVIHRFFATMQSGNGPVIVKMTVKESAQANRSNPLYTVEAVELNEKSPAAQWVGEIAEADGIDPRTTRSVGDVISLAQTVQDRNNDAALSRSAGAGLTVEEVQQAITSDTFGHAVDVYASIAETPDYIRQQAEREGATDVEGFFDPRTNRVALIANNLASAERAQQVARHELIGHYGITNMVGRSEMANLARRVIQAEAEGNAQILDIAAQVDATQPGLSPQRRGMEIIAVMAERNLQNKIVKRVLDAIRTFLKERGFLKTDITDAQIAKLLREAQTYLREQSRPMVAGDAAPAFSRDQASMSRSGDETTLFQFAGENARNADRVALDIARSRINAGEDAETVRQETGWFKGVDGKWRFEISDQGAKFKKPFPSKGQRFGDVFDAAFKMQLDSGNLGIKLGDMIQHDVLFAAYPQLADIAITTQPGSGGSFSAASSLDPATIRVGEDLQMFEAMSVVLHEVQHAIQKREGFAMGGSVDIAGIVKAQAKSRWDYWSNVWSIQREINTGLSVDEAVAALNELDFGIESEHVAELSKHTPEELQRKNDEAYEELKALDGSSRDIYKRIAGEVEARNTQARENMSDEERRATPPSATADTPSDKVIIVIAGNDVAHASMSEPLGQSVDEGDKRGYIQFGADRKFNIALLENADLSTFLHETGHFYLEVLGDLAADPNASQEIKDDYASILKFLGVESREQIGVEQHELFARANEAYLREGRAPSPELRGVFQKFKAWLEMIYQSIQALNVTLNDEVRGVFDRMYASDAEIEAAEREADISSLFATAQDAGMTDQEFAAYAKSVEGATARAKDTLRAKLMRQFQRERTAWWNEELERVRLEVAAEVDAQPVYRAFDALTKGELPDGTPFKLDKANLVEQFGAVYVKRIPRGYGEGRGAVYSTDGSGLHHDAAADLLGYGSGSELVEALVNMRPRKALIEEEAKQRMKDRHGDLLTDGSISDEATNALHNEERANILRTELRAIRKKQTEVAPFVKLEADKAKADADFAKREREYERRWMEAEKKLAIDMERGIAAERIAEVRAEIAALKEQAAQEKRERAYERRWMDAERNTADAQRRQQAQAATETPPVSAFRDAARGIIGQTAVRDIRPFAYLQAERRAAKAAFSAMAKGDYMEAATQKQRELLNHYLYREATDALETADRIYDYARGFTKTRTRQKFGKAGGPYLEQIDSLLAQYEFADVTKGDLVRRENLLRFIEERIEDGEPVMIPDSVLLDAQQRNYLTLPFDQLLAVRDAIKNIEHMVNLKTRLMTVQEGRALEEVVEQGAATIAEHGTLKDTPVGTRTVLDRAREIRDGYFAAHRKLASLLREMDGWQDDGFMWNTFMKPINEAANKKALMAEDATKKLAALYAKLEKPGLVNKVKGLGLMTKEFYPTLNRSLSKADLLALALNWGNEGNRQRIRDGYNWTDQQVLAAMNRLEVQEWDFVQGMWDLIDSYWPEIAAQDKRVNGIAPEKVERTPFILPNGRTIEGGYYPIKYDERHSVRSYQDRAKEEADRILRGAVARPGVDTGFTKDRAGKVVDRKIKLDLGVGLQHIDTVLQTLTHREMLIDLNKILGASKMNGAILDYYGIETYKAMQEAIVDIAAGEVGAKDAFEAGMAWLRSGVTVAGMGLNLTTALMQPLGITQSMVRIGPKWAARGIARFIGDALHMENAAKFVHDKSDMMRLRSKTQNREIAEIRNKVGRGGVMPKVEEAYFYAIVKMQAVVDIPTWLGAYEKHMAEDGANEARAIALADQAVIDAQGGGQVKDLAGIQRGGPLKKLFTTFYSYFSATWNLSVESAGRTDFKKIDDVARFAVDMLLLYTVPVVLTAMLKEAVKGSGGPDDDEEWYAWLAKEQLSFMTGSLVGLRELSSSIQGMYGYSGPAGTRFFSEAGKLIKQAGQGEADAALLKAANNTAGILFHYPAGQVQRTTEGFMALKDGTTVNPAALLFGPPKE